MVKEEPEDEDEAADEEYLDDEEYPMDDFGIVKHTVSRQGHSLHLSG